MPTLHDDPVGVLPDWLHLPTPLDPATIPAALTEPLADGFRVIMPDDPDYHRTNT